ncbi:hypothetical protein P9294_gp193 [Bacillus phage FADO]|uniref:Uncharacterized protein n=1 Tax=Bacillus phage FADO TaxID=2917160 RepID=A0AAE9K744_9CAUD|nr:hypothetical protein P9294_gp193 [Bacillus phage FADO]UNY48908.1 hypothetical protein fado_193 [Bacillus phage FADO]UUG68094.1 hypothetical protein [Bacillus phage PK-3]
MARGKTKLTNAFESFADVKQEPKVEPKQETVKEEVVNNDAIVNTTVDATHDSNEVKTVKDMANNIVIDYREKMKKPTMEETHIRRSYLIDRELDKRLNKLANKQGRGFKTHFINQAISLLLDEIE